MFAEPVVPFVSGEAFAGAVTPVRIIGAASLMSCVSYFVAMCILSPLCRERQMAVSSIAAAPVSVVLNLLLDGPFGAVGARCAFGRRGDSPAHRALVRPRRALVLRAPARPGAHGGVQRGRRSGVRGLRMVARDRVLRRSRSDRDRGPVGLQRRGHRRRSGPARQHGPHAGGKGPRGLAGQMVAFPWRLDEPPPYDVGTRIHHRQLRLEFVRDYRLLSHQRISVVLPQNVPGRDAGLATIKYGGMMLLLLCEV